MVSPQPHTNGLMEWECYAGAPSAGATRVLSHPLFAQAARALAVNMLQVIERDRALGRICRDAGRYVAAMAALQLHLSGALTLARLKDACVASGFMSPGRARAVLRVLQELGYIAPAAASPGLGARRFVPTDDFLAAWCNHLRAALRAATIIEPAAALASDMLDRPDGAALFIRLQGEGLLRSAPLSDQRPPLMRILLQHDGGILIVWHMLAAGDDADTFPTPRAAQLSLAGISRRFGVSRVQLRRLVRAAAHDGVFAMGEQRTVTFAAGCHDELRFLYAAQLAQLLASAAGTMRRMGEAANDACRSKLSS